MADSHNLSTDPRKLRSADNALPPVEPPNAGFIVQLFVVPAIIVLIIVLVWLMFTRLAQLGGLEPKEYLQQIEQDNANSWFAAHKLADELRTSSTLKNDDKIARQLAGMLDAQIEAAKMDDDKIRLRIFLCKALGEFHVADGLPALLKAATTQRQPQEIDVRRSAIEALALLVSNAKDPTLRSKIEAETLPMLLAASRDDSPQVREPTAFALGTLGGEQATARLIEVLNDSHANTRYNAATGLARRGNPACVEVLTEMLDVAELNLDSQESEGLSESEKNQARDFKRALISVNGLRAVRQLQAAGSSGDVSALQAAVQQILDSPLESLFTDAKYAAEVRVHANEVKQLLEK